MNGLIIGLHLLSFHTAPGYETVTPGIYVQTTEGYTFGVLRNSEKSISTYGGFTWENGRWSVTAGAITGYKSAKVLPLLIPSYKFDSFRLSFIPNPKGASAFHISKEF